MKALFADHFNFGSQTTTLKEEQRRMEFARKLTPQQRV